MSDSKPRHVVLHVHHPDDPPLEFVYREDGMVEQLSGLPGVVVEVPVHDGPTMTVRIEHDPDGPTWTGLTPLNAEKPASPTQ